MGTISKRIIYGAMGLGGDCTGDGLSSEAVDSGIDVLQAAYDVGIRKFDHADIYNKGNAERVFGEFVRQGGVARNELFVQSKAGIILGGIRGSNYYDFSAGHIMQSVKGSLERMGLDYLDRFFLHRPDPVFQPAELKEVIDELFAEGMIRDIGVSNMSSSYIRMLENVLERKVSANQLELSLMKTDFVDQVVDFNTFEVLESEFDDTITEAMVSGVEIQAWRPLARGYLSGRDNRECSEEVVATAGIVERLAVEKKTSRESIVLAWLLKHPAGIVPVVGTANIGRIQGLVDCAEVELSREEWYELYLSSRGRRLP